MVALQGVVLAAEEPLPKSHESRVRKMYEDSKKAFAEVPEYKLSQLKNDNKEDYVLVDTRAEEEQNVSVIPGAISVKEFEKNMEVYKSKIVVAYCTIGFRSGLFARKLIKKNIKAYNLEGSILGWVHSGGELRDKQGLLTNKVHVFGSSYNLLPPNYEGVW